MKSQKLLNLFNQGVQLKQQGSYNAARNTLRQIISEDTSCFEVWFELGDVNMRQAIFKNAAQCYSRVVALKPDYIMGHALLGLAYYNMNLLEQAISSYLRVLEIEPDNLSALCNIALSYLGMGHRNETLKYCRQALKIDANLHGAHLLQANALSALGQYEEACLSYQAAQKIQPDDMSAIAGQANALLKMGQYAQVFDIVSPYIEALSNNVDINIAYAGIAKQFSCQNKAQKCLERLIDLKGLSNEQYIQLYFSAGELCDKTEQYDKAFFYYEAGNNRVNRQYDGPQENQLVDEIIHVFSKPKIEYTDSIKTDKRHVFIVGMPRSGTSLVEQILSRHNKVYSAGELNKIPELSTNISNNKKGNDVYPESVADINNDEIKKLALMYSDCFSDADDKVTILTDKLPHNFMYLGFIEKLFPNALIIHCRRNPVDTSLSNYFQYFSGPLGYPYKLENIAAHYLNYQKLMDHWQSKLSLPILQIDYEALVSDQEAVSRNMLEFCGLEWQQKCLSFYESERVARTASHAQVRKKIYTSSVNKWKNYEKHLSVLMAKLAN